MKKALLLLCLTQISIIVTAQLRLSCIVKDAFNKQNIIAKITINNTLTIDTDSLGFFSIEVQQGDSIAVSAASYNTAFFIINAALLPSQILLEGNMYYPNNIQAEGLLVSKNVFATPGSIYTITESEQLRGNPVFLQNYFNLAPGVLVQSRNPVATGARFIMRGIGSQTPNYGSGIKVYLNNVPLTDADGTTIIDDIDFDNLSRRELAKGPQGSVYGTGGGGEVQLYTKRALANANSIGQSYLTGSNGLVKTNTYAGATSEKSNVRFNYGHQQYNGYRMHSSSTKDFLDLNADVVSDAKRSVSFYVGYSKSFDLLAGALDSITNSNHPDSAELSYINTNAYQYIESARTSIEQEYKFSSKFTNVTSVFVSTQSVRQLTPANLLKTNKNKFGGRFLFIYTPKFGKRQARIIAGGEFIKNVNYQNTYTVSSTGSLGTPKTDLELQPFMSSAFTELNLQMDKYVSVTAGASANYNYFDVIDNRVSTANPLYVNNSGIKHFTPSIATHVALNRNFGNHNLYLNYNESYSLPTYDQVFISRLGRINDTIQAEKIACFEIGLKGNLFKNAFHYQFAFYTLELTNRLTPQTVSASGSVPAYVFYTNLYNARNNGVEFSGNYTYKPKEKNAFITIGRLFFNYTYNNFNNADYKSDNNNNTATKDYTDLAVSGVPRHIMNLGFDFLLNTGLSFSFTHYITTQVPLNLAATNYAPAYNLSSLKAGWKLINSNEYKRRQWHIDVFAGIDNIFHNANQQILFVNAINTAANQLPKYFNPANPNATIYSGCNIAYSF